MKTFRPSAWQLLRRVTCSYTISPDDLVMKRGIIRRRTKRIPREKITNVDLALNYVLPGMSGVKVNVGSGEPIVCTGLTRKNARTLSAVLHNALVTIPLRGVDCEAHGKQTRGGEAA
jgi:uncharacterized membrane protein YdbT with pleckstrin-like domain